MTEYLYSLEDLNKELEEYVNAGKLSNLKSEIVWEFLSLIKLKEVRNNGK